MAANFKINDEVRLNKPAPQGSILQLGVDQEGNISYLVLWTDAEGNTQQRWFKEDDLVKV
ncbi:MAG: hypothetical protein EBR82_60290 [Caulobacteraceae bacterium]|nr:hypothetical protein [Caulobacteraceae bacterium]